jgi:DNA primase
MVSTRPSSLLDEYKDLKKSCDLRVVVTGEVYDHQDAVMWPCPAHVDGGRDNLALYPTYSACFRCGWQGDVHDFLVKSKSISWKLSDTVRLLKSKEWPKPEEVEKVDLPPIEPEVIERYQKTLYGDKDALAYLKSRGLSDKTIQEAKLGYNGYAFTIPVFDSTGEKCLTIRFRKDDKKCSPNAPKYYGMSGRNGVLLYNAHVLRGQKIALLTEGEICSLASTQAGVPGLSFTNGKSAWSDKYNDLFNQLDVLYVAFDMDSASVGRVFSIAPKLKPLVKTLKYVKWPQRVAKDVDELINKHGVKEFEKYLKESRVIGL